MFAIDPDDRVYSVFKIGKIVECLKAEGVPLKSALEGIHISEAELSSPLTKVSASQIVRSYRNALTYSENPILLSTPAPNFTLLPLGSMDSPC